MRYTQECTQELLSEKAGLDYRHYQKIESGKVSLRIETLERIVSAMGFSLLQFFQLFHSFESNIPTDANITSKTSRDLISILLKTPHDEVFDTVIDSIIEHGELLHTDKKELLEGSEIPIVECTELGKFLWMNQASVNLFSDCCIGSSYFPLSRVSEHNCSHNCQFEAYPIQKVGSLVQASIFLKFPSDIHFFFWGKVIDEDRIRFACNSRTS